jgi:hypothetical protein
MLTYQMLNQTIEYHAETWIFDASVCVLEPSAGHIWIQPYPYQPT